MEQLYLTLDRLPISQINVKGSEINAHVIDKRDDAYRYILVISESNDPYIRENEKVSLRRNRNGVRYIKRLPEIDENNSILMGFLVRFEPPKGTFLVMSDCHTTRLSTSFYKEDQDICLAAIPNESLVAIMPKNLNDYDITILYFSDRFVDNQLVVGGVNEMERAIAQGTILMSKSNRYVRRAVFRIKNEMKLQQNNNENVPIHAD